MTYDKKIKQLAQELRKQNYSYKEIAKELNIAKSTAHYWLKDEYSNHEYSSMSQREWLNKIRKKSILAKKNAKNKKIQIITQKVSSQISSLNLNLETKRALLASLYWAEGSKTQHSMTFPNTDPKLILMFITLLRDCFQLDEKRLRVNLHLHNYHDEKQSKQYWSDLLKIPLDQFNKTNWKKTPNTGKRYRKNFQGICVLRYNSVDLQREIIAYAFSLGDKINNKPS